MGSSQAGPSAVWTRRPASPSAAGTQSGAGAPAMRLRRRPSGRQPRTGAPTAARCGTARRPARRRRRRRRGRWGRRGRIRGAARRARGGERRGGPPAGWPWPLEGGDRLLGGLQDREQRVELGKLEQRLQVFVEPRQAQIPALLADLLREGHEEAQARPVAVARAAGGGGGL